MRHKAEQARLGFIEGRDGYAGAHMFAWRSLRQYRKALAERNARGHRTGYGLVYRRELILSCLSFRDYLRVPKE